MRERTICREQLDNNALADEATLLHRYRIEGDTTARDVLSERMLPLVRHIAHRYANRGEPVEDLVQVGSLGLLKAIDRFDIERGVKLSTFAAPNIAGEIKRHFRDRGWSIRVPRDVQELNARLTSLVDRLTVHLARSPTVDELEAELGVDSGRVLEAIQGAQSYSTVPLQEAPGEGRDPAETIGDVDPGYALAESRALISDGCAVLSERERELLRLRFYLGLTQREIAERVGISQMHVSRLIRRSLDEVRARLDSEELEQLPRGSEDGAG
jgi:RNA polymerase sigma-B factor